MLPTVTVAAIEASPKIFDQFIYSSLAVPLINSSKFLRSSSKDSQLPINRPIRMLYLIPEHSDW